MFYFKLSYKGDGGYKLVICSLSTMVSNIINFVLIKWTVSYCTPSFARRPHSHLAPLPVFFGSWLDNSAYGQLNQIFKAVG